VKHQQQIAQLTGRGYFHWLKPTSSDWARQNG